MIGTKYKSKKTNEVIELTKKRQITITLYDVKSSFGNHHSRTHVVGDSELKRRWEEI